MYTGDNEETELFLGRIIIKVRYVKGLSFLHTTHAVCFDWK